MVAKNSITRPRERMERASPTSMDFDRAEELLAYLNPINPEWSYRLDGKPRMPGLPRAEWLFRGQRDAAWDVVATAHRDDAWPHGWQTTQSLVEREHEALRRFLSAADRAGLRVPGDSPDVRTVLERQPASWPPPEVISVLAFGRHHGLPTRLVDWTRSRYVACFFASELPNPHEAQPERLAVFAVHRPPEYMAQEGLTFSDARFGGNPNMAAQAGTFTFEHVRNNVFDEPPMATSELWRTVGGLVKLTLPTMEALPLRVYLQRLGISASSVFPNPEGAVQTALEAKPLEETVLAWQHRKSATTPGTEEHGHIVGMLDALKQICSARGIKIERRHQQLLEPPERGDQERVLTWIQRAADERSKTSSDIFEPPP